MENYLPYLKEGGKAKLQTDLTEAAEPLEFISKLSSFEYIDKNDLGPFYNLMGTLNRSTTDVFSDILRQQLIEFKQKILTMNQEELRILVKEIEPFSEIGEFQELLKIALSRVPKISQVGPLPESVEQNLTPKEKADIYIHDTAKFNEWLDSLFSTAMLDFSNDDFGYHSLFKEIAPIVFQKRRLAVLTNEYCENQFEMSSHPIYTIIRFYMAIFNSPIAQIDFARPLALIIYGSFHGVKANIQLMKEASQLAGAKLAHIIFSVPQVTMTSKVLYYGEFFGFTHEENKKFIQDLERDNDYTLARLSNSTLYCRIATIAWIQGIKINQQTIKFLSISEPQTDLGLIMARKYKKEYDVVLQNWAQKNSWIYIDYLTRIKASGLEVPAFTTKPDLTPQQASIAQVLLLL
ncbi:hypothetical protein TVAG_126200 [Trichomonas vaginalis G3]|uniref:Uncharacterized protein n=1 Tax=Trichomonas vaginalis (strain ATCC PRA-98 / G3) TaxID=412133 RepID=A2ED08_TRIV3|nr:hypothetical protein TVAGG3_0860660 [Trichomonas vaginalis G3]EAY09459.1 hypothetical protein TVAG_126200 [Trichomonas vaginalis G3]KAI5500646.1 hypothetical protein TVAGG3_0860660 [Trichomonas vaginalis G3]|eukprot:XP_001321682.1 hypothetical protein [Trichomonas vaginalis G3]